MRAPPPWFDTRRTGAGIIRSCIPPRRQKTAAAHPDRRCPRRVRSCRGRSLGSPGSIPPPRDRVLHSRTSGTTDGWAQLFLTAGADSFQEREVHLLPTAEVVMHEPACHTSGGRDVLDGGPLIAALGEQRVRGIEDLVAPFGGAQAKCTRPAASCSKHRTIDKSSTKLLAYRQ